LLTTDKVRRIIMRHLRLMAASKKRAIGILGVALAFGIGATQALSATSSAPTASSLTTSNVYTPPSGPELTTEQVREIAVSQALVNGESNPTDVTAVNGTLQEALRAMDPSMGSPGDEAEMNSSAKLVVMHGHFTLAAAQVPHGHTAPTGSVMTLIVDAHTGFIEGRSIGEEVPSETQLERPVSIS
jgi:hypothetical protein